jgi:hypothetical protein
MRREDLIKPDLFSDCLLCAGGIAMLVILVVVMVVACTHTVALR